MTIPNSRLVYVDEAYDRDYASDRVSRYGAYLWSRSHLFVDGCEPLDAVSFACLSWQVGCSPVMSPGYVQLHPVVDQVRCRGSEDEPGEVLVAELDVRLPHPAQVRQLGVSGWRDWDRDRPWLGEPGRFIEPPDNHAALVFTARFVVVIGAGELPAPARPGLDVGLAKQAVAEVFRLINLAAGSDVQALLAGWRGVAR